MNHSIEQILIEQNPHWQGHVYTCEFARLHDKPAMEMLNLDELQVISGIRRSGKSTLMQFLINQLQKSRDSSSILYLNLDDPNYISIYDNPALMYDIITTAEKLTNKTIKYLFLDEIQNVNGWEQFVKSVYDRKRFNKIVVTGSNADLLKSEYATLLSGRYIETKIYPLSFKEIALKEGITSELELIKEKSKVLNHVSNMLTYGGFPRIHQLAQEQRLILLKAYYETILLKDCIQNHHVRDTKTMIALTHYLLSNISSRYSYTSLGKAIGSNENTVKQFSNYLTNAHMINEITLYSYSLKQQAHTKKKIYCIDNGLISASTFKFSNNYGKLLENLVFTELYKQGFHEIYYYNDNKECDFIIHSEDAPLAIQVCYELNQQNQQREISGLEAAMKKFTIPKGIIITFNTEQALVKNISAMPFWKFFYNFSK